MKLRKFMKAGRAFSKCCFSPSSTTRVKFTLNVPFSLSFKGLNDFKLETFFNDVTVRSEFVFAAAWQLCKSGIKTARHSVVERINTEHFSCIVGSMLCSKIFFRHFKCGKHVLATRPGEILVSISVVVWRSDIFVLPSCFQSAKLIARRVK